MFRVRADLVAHFDLRSFPFDSHRLQIAFEDKVLQDNRLVYEPDPDMTGIHPSAVVVGWNLDKNGKCRSIKIATMCTDRATRARRFRSASIGPS